MISASQAQQSDKQLEALFGTGYYPPHHALWHLKKLGCVDNLANFEGGAWSVVDDELANQGIRVALLDTPVAWRHPNLRDALEIGLIRDFSACDTGAFVVDRKMIDGDEERALEQQRFDLDAELLKQSNSSICKNFVTAIRREMSCGENDPAVVSDAHNSHGTAMAGLIVGRPVECNMLETPLWGEAEHGFETQPVPLPYAGINPWARLVPVSLPSAPSVDAVRNALDYVGLIGAKVVVIASSWRAPKVDCNSEYPEQDWASVEEALTALSESGVIILSAAGNEGDTSKVYPAKLSKTIKNLFQVTACAPDGALVTYAPKPVLDPDQTDRSGAEVPEHQAELLIGKSIRGLSGQVEALNQQPPLRDPWQETPPNREFLNDKFPANLGAAKSYHSRQLITTDVPGPRGYNPSPYRWVPEDKDDVHLEYGSLYTGFSGTSAATAVAGGLISLALMSKMSGEAEISSGLFDMRQASALIRHLRSKKQIHQF